MKKAFYKILSFSLALIVLLSTVSFTVDRHYCSNVLVGSSLFGYVETCSMQVRQKPFLLECDISKKDCCSNEQMTVEGQENVKASFDKLEKDKQLLVAAFIHNNLNLFFELQADLNYFKYYTPPHLVKDFQVLGQTFLI
ncbi:hypothetical protein JM83_2188 [Gillisia sp. Hel_I_86]|uniref:HYC_CC_PP family protein n=1 Tax=Gillisia sp. Hel_I_86 TaxID=1249981 RepID=UPI00119C8FA5|nr:hypothetical protein [Gillisia sp. Hel_I_86]TVZ27163.1 hypothetical protein JM83_2188 [Gillisia sp. Hel_I_86]